MKNWFLSILIAFAMVITACTSQKPVSTGSLPAYVPESQGLHDTIVMMDSLFFDSYNNCKLDVFESLVSEDLEFYHDKGGLTRYDENMRSIQKRCTSSFIVRRELVPGSTEVFPIKDYGAIQLGSHRFYIKNKGEAEQLDGTFRFVHVWKNENGRWRIARVVSFDH